MPGKKVNNIISLMLIYIQDINKEKKILIHKVSEGEKTHFGLNWFSDKNSFIVLKILIPIWPILPKQYDDFDTENIFHGWQIKTICFCFKIRRWKDFPPKIQKVIFKFSSSIQSLGKQKFIATREMIEDNQWT